MSPPREIPPDYGGLSPQVNRMMDRLAQELVKKYRGKLRRLLLGKRDVERGTGLFFTEVAERLIPESYAVNVRIAGAIVSRAAREVLTPKEDKAVRARNVEVRQRLAGTLTDPTNALAAQGKTLWSDAERARVRRLSEDARYHYTSGPHKGKHNIELITAIFNVKRGRGRPARTITAVRDELESMKRERGVPLITFIDWMIVRPALQRLARQKKYRYPPDTPHPGELNWIAIAAKLCELFPDQPTITAKNCSVQYAALRRGEDPPETDSE